MKPNTWSTKAGLKIGLIVAISAALIGIHFVAAQTDSAATSTDQVASSTDQQVPQSDGTVPGEATTTAATSSDVSLLDASSTQAASSSSATSSDDASTTPPSPPADAPADATSSTSTTPTGDIQPAARPALLLPDFTAASTSDAVSAGITSLEDAYFSKNRKYLQILPGSILPSYESGNVASRLGEDIPSNARVDIYQAPSGWGYQITFQKDGNEYSIGEGPEASARSYTIQLPTLIATSTAASSTATIASSTSSLEAATSTASTTAQ